MNKVFDFKLKPLVRLLWASKGAKEYWESKIIDSQNLVYNARLEAYKRGILKTFPVFIYNGTHVDTELDEANYGEKLFTVNCTPTKHRTHKLFYDKLGSGKLHFFSNDKDVLVFNEDAYKTSELYLTLGYSEADLPNSMWYTMKATNGIVNPMAEMMNPDKMNYLLNPFLMHLGISIIPYVAKSWDDEYSLELAKKILDIMKEIDPETTKDVIALLEMPTRCSTWRGLADITTPIFKSYTDTTSYVDKIIVDYEVKMSYYIRGFIPGAPYGTIFPWISKKQQNELKK